MERGSDVMSEYRPVAGIRLRKRRAVPGQDASATALTSPASAHGSGIPTSSNR
ncbi:unnamed protein product [Haemonchus placei]|uniref:Uncharacterized protein n=1 Tax=Haemonchus placei TaxID=6290 RepID=A0A0N4VZT3_HAEPC|nr:unnamed protein product [Haemonchus placei]